MKDEFVETLSLQTEVGLRLTVLHSPPAPAPVPVLRCSGPSRDKGPVFDRPSSRSQPYPTGRIKCHTQSPLSESSGLPRLGWVQECHQSTGPSRASIRRLTEGSRVEYLSRSPGTHRGPPGLVSLVTLRRVCTSPSGVGPRHRSPWELGRLGGGDGYRLGVSNLGVRSRRGEC